MKWILRFQSWDAYGNTLCIGGFVFDHVPTDKECGDAIDELIADSPARTARVHARIIDPE